METCKPIHILGISAFYHDSAACLIRDGQIIAAAQEERFTRKKHDSGFPANAVRFCLAEAGIAPGEIDYVAYYEKPLIKFERILETYLHFAPKGLGSFLKAMPVWMREKLFLAGLLNRQLNAAFGLGKKDRIAWEKKFLYPEHHQSHAASAFFPSPFESAAVLTVDGVGEWATSSVGHGRGNKLDLICEMHFPNSVGLLYSAFTYYTGFKVNSGEYKVMGLAPYGKPKYAQLIYDHLIDLKEDGSFRMNMDYFNYCTGLTMTNAKFHALFGGSPRKPESALTQREMDLARSVQEVTEEILIRMARFARKETGEGNLCMAGGVSLNCVANGKILKEGIFKKIWVQPAAGDSGAAIGAAMAAWHQYLDKPRAVAHGNDSMLGSYLGPSPDNQEIQSFLTRGAIPHQRLNQDELLERVAALLSQDKIIGWVQGRMEFGPRALGARSILGDARSPGMQSKMNLKIKYRESFRPFAPAVTREALSEYFDLEQESPYMLMVAPVAEKRRLPVNGQAGLWGIDFLKVPRSDIPAVTHVDYSARVQTVHEETNPYFHRLLQAFEKKTGCPVLVNTSFNVRGEPIVCTPQDAYRCFMRTDMDFLVLGDYLLDKSQQKKIEHDPSWKKEFELD